MGVVLVDRNHSNEIKLHDTGDDGYSILVSELSSAGLKFAIGKENLHSIVDRLNSGDVLWICVPKNKLSGMEKEKVSHFLSRGGGLLLTAEWGNIYNNADHMNDLLAYLGSELRFNPDRITDEKNAVSKKVEFMGTVMEEKKIPHFIKVHDFNPHITTSGIKEIYYMSGCSISGPEKHALMRSAPSSFSDRDANRKIDPDEEFGTFALAAWDIRDGGRMILIGDSSSWTNRYIYEGDNMKFIKNVFLWLSRKL